MSTKFVAIDCEMVGGPYGKNLPARVALVNEQGQVILDKYIYQTSVSDYRTHISGITASQVANGDSLATVKSQVANAINGKILVGHSLDCDLDALGLSHPTSMRRDLATHPPFMRLNNGQPASLKDLAWRFLNRNIQSGVHSPVEDAKASMDIYVANRW